MQSSVVELYIYYTWSWKTQPEGFSIMYNLFHCCSKEHCCHWSGKRKRPFSENGYIQDILQDILYHLTSSMRLTMLEKYPKNKKL